MSGIPLSKDTNGNPVVDSHALGRSTGTSAQNWAGPVMAGTSSSLSNSSGVAAPGNPTPKDKAPGFLAASQPGGHNASVLVPGGQYNTDDQIQTVAPLAGTTGGGGTYPNITGASAVKNPMVAPGWHVQNQTGDEFAQVVITTASPLPGQSHTVALSIQLAASGGVGALTWSVVSGALPSPCTMSAGGLISGTATAAGTSAFTVKAVDASGNQAEKVFSITLS